MNIRAAVLLIALAITNAWGNEAHKLLSQLTEEKRSIALAHMVRGSGEKCGVVSQTFYQGNDKRGNAFWNARCDTGNAYIVMVYNDSQGSTKVLGCNTLRAVAGVACFTKF